jgi:hypothetical protein
MPRSAKEHSERSRGLTLLQEFEKSLPDFKNLDKDQHLEFAKAIRLLCRYFDVSESRLQRDHRYALGTTITRLNELYDEYCAKDAIIASAISIVKLHIESRYLDNQDADLVHNLTSLHICPAIPNGISSEPDCGVAPIGASVRIRKNIGRLVDQAFALIDQARVDPSKVFLRE